jgi:hypothetical protein
MENEKNAIIQKIENTESSITKLKAIVIKRAKKVITTIETVNSFLCPNLLLKYPVKKANIPLIKVEAPTQVEAVPKFIDEVELKNDVRYGSKPPKENQKPNCMKRQIIRRGLFFKNKMRFKLLSLFSLVFVIVAGFFFV